LLDAEHRGSFLDLIEAPADLDGAFVRAAMSHAGRTKFSLLACPPDCRPIDGIDPRAVCTAIRAVRGEYEVTILDMPALWSGWTHAVLRACDTICLVVQPTGPALRYARRQIETLQKEELGDIPLRVIANKVPTSRFGGAKFPRQAVEEMFGRDVDYIVPQSDAMQAAAEAGKPLCDVYGGAALEAALADMMEDIIGARVKEFQERRASH
jgi:pilus assembly protein CpaE